MLGIIGGSGLYDFPELRILELLKIKTPYGDSDVFVERVEFGGKSFFFLPRHGKKHIFPPHRINYRANIDALSQLGVENVLAVCTVGGITEKCPPGQYCLPNQIIDYTWGREHTFVEDFESGLEHIDFTHPFSEKICAEIKKTANKLNIVLTEGCYGCTQGPRLETAAEIRKFKMDGCDMVGMTLMPEAALAKEKNLEYGAISLVVNWAAGVEDLSLNMVDIKKTFTTYVPALRQLILETVMFF